MNDFVITLAGASLFARASGALWWPERRLLVVSDLHLGKAERIARRGGTLLPPYDTAETLTRLEDEVAHTSPATVICLGDSFDDDRAAGMLPPGVKERLLRLMAGRHWVWIAGNHDPGPTLPGGTHKAELYEAPLTFRHEAVADCVAEVSGHFHPKATLSIGGRRVSRPCFLADDRRIILPAFGAYTGGLAANAPALSALMGPGAIAVLTGPRICALPLAAITGSSRPARVDRCG